MARLSVSVQKHVEKRALWPRCSIRVNVPCIASPVKLGTGHSAGCAKSFFNPCGQEREHCIWLSKSPQISLSAQPQHWNAMKVLALIGTLHWAQVAYNMNYLFEHLRQSRAAGQSIKCVRFIEQKGEGRMPRGENVTQKLRGKFKSLRRARYRWKRENMLCTRTETIFTYSWLQKTWPHQTVLLYLKIDLREIRGVFMRSCILQSDVFPYLFRYPM